MSVPESVVTEPGAALSHARRSPLALLLGGMPQKEFFDEVLERRPAHFRQALKPFEAERFFGLGPLDRLFSHVDLRYPLIEVIEDGTAGRPPTMRTGVVDRIALLKRIREGASIRIRDLQVLVPEAMSFARELSQELSGFVNVNAYVTPPGRRAFDPHFDDHDVFVVQCFGEKRWLINEEYDDKLELPNPRVGNAGQAPTRVSRPETERAIELTVGDVLYLPRGTLHAATAGSTGSVHVTVSYSPITLGKLMALAVEHAERADPEFRKMASPTLFRRPEEVHGNLVAKFRELAASLDPGAAAAAARDELLEAIPGPSAGILIDIFTPVQIDGGTRLELRRDGAYVAIRDGNGVVERLVTHGMEFVLGDSEKEYFRRIERSAASFVPMELSDDGDPAEPLAFVRLLVEEGIIGLA